MTSLDFEFALPDNIIHFRFEDDAGAVAAAQQALARFPEPVSRGDATFEENLFQQMARLFRNAMIDEGFLVVPEPPMMGVVAYVGVRYHVGADAESIKEIVTESAAGGRFVLEEPDVSQRRTPLGLATRNLLRYTNPVPESARFARKLQAPIVEQLSWYWAVEGPNGEPLVVNLTSFAHDLAVTGMTRPIIDSFAEAMTFARDSPDESSEHV